MTNAILDGPVDGSDLLKVVTRLRRTVRRLETKFSRRRAALPSGLPRQQAAKLASPEELAGREGQDHPRLRSSATPPAAGREGNGITGGDACATVLGEISPLRSQARSGRNDGSVPPLTRPSERRGTERKVLSGYAPTFDDGQFEEFDAEQLNAEMGSASWPDPPYVDGYVMRHLSTGIYLTYFHSVNGAMVPLSFPAAWIARRTIARRFGASAVCQFEIFRVSGRRFAEIRAEIGKLGESYGEELGDVLCRAENTSPGLSPSFREEGYELWFDDEPVAPTQNEGRRRCSTRNSRRGKAGARP